jgi:hypothetical protein
VTINYIDTAFVDNFVSITDSLVATDTDLNSVLSYGIVGGTDNGLTVIKTDTYGTLTVTKATGVYSFVPNSAAIEPLIVDVIDNSFVVKVSDGSLTDSKALAISITQNGVTESNGNDTLFGTPGTDRMAGGLGKDIYSLSEITPATDTLIIATADSLVTNYDIVNGFELGTGIVSAVGVDRLDLPSTLIAANVINVNGTDFGNVGSHSISNGLVSFANVIGDTPLAITAANLTDAINYVQSAITGNNTVAFVSDGNTFIFQDGGVTDTLVELVGVMANSVNNSGLATGAVWIV